MSICFSINEFSVSSHSDGASIVSFVVDAVDSSVDAVGSVDVVGSVVGSVGVVGVVVGGVDRMALPNFKEDFE